MAERARIRLWLTGAALVPLVALAGFSHSSRAEDPGPAQPPTQTDRGPVPPDPEDDERLPFRLSDSPDLIQKKPTVFPDQQLELPLSVDEPDLLSPELLHPAAKEPEQLKHEEPGMLLLPTSGFPAPESEILSLDDLLSTIVVTASKHEEPFFEAPLSTVVITREDIQKSGATNLPEALRLAPGVTVREQAPGSYQIGIRGLDGLLPGGMMINFTNNLTLFMIDDRIVYNYLNGGVYWQAIPVEIIDVERIEIVRGSSSALFGPNAAMGVIRIFTRQAKEEGFRFDGRAEMGAQAKAGVESMSAGSGSLAVRYRRGAFRAMATAHAQIWRKEDLYYSVPEKKYLPLDQASSGLYGPLRFAMDRFPEPGVALRQLGTNLFLAWKWDLATIDLALGYYDMRTLTGMVDHVWETIDSRGYHLSLSVKSHGFLAHVDYLDRFERSLGNASNNEPDLVSHPAGGVRAALEYEHTWNQRKLKAGLDYIRPSYTSSAFSRDGVNRGEGTIPSVGMSLRFEDRPLGWLRLIAAGRLDHYQNIARKWNPSWQLVALTQPSKSSVVRAVYGRSFRPPFILDTQMSLDYGETLGPTNPIPGINLPVDSFSLYGDPGLEPFVVDSWELGYRQKLGDALFWDSDIFLSRGHGFSAIGLPSELSEMVRINPETGNLLIVLGFRPMPTRVTMVGGTLSLIYQPASSLTLRTHLTLQRTELEDFIMISIIPDKPPYSDPFDTQARGTPVLYGGMQATYTGLPHLTLSLNPYWMSGYELEHYVAGLAKLPGSFYLQAHARYQIGRSIEIHATLRNIRLGRQEPQYVFGDYARPSLHLGLRASF